MGAHLSLGNELNLGLGCLEIVSLLIRDCGLTAD